MILTKRTDLIPILYMGGTGGHFISSFLYSARTGEDSWVFSTSGHTLF